MQDIEKLTSRIERLERSNQRLRVGLLGVAALLGMVVLMGTTTNQTPSVLEAEKFILKDHSGRERGWLYANESSWGLVLYNSDSSKGAAFIVSDFGSAAMLMSKTGNPGVSAMAFEDANTLAVNRLKTNHVAMELKTNSEASLLRFLDAKGIDRVDLTLMHTGTSALLLNDAASETRTVLNEDSPGLATFDPKGTFVWSAGFDGLSKQEQEKIRVLMQKPKQH